MGDTFGGAGIEPEDDDPEGVGIQALDDDADLNPPYDPPVGHAWATWLE